jgi:hypothetical protein
VQRHPKLLPTADVDPAACIANAQKRAAAIQLTDGLDAAETVAAGDLNVGELAFDAL